MQQNINNQQIPLIVTCTTFCAEKFQKMEIESYVSYNFKQIKFSCMLAFSPDVKRILCHYFKEKNSKIYHQVDVSLKNLISTFCGRKSVSSHWKTTNFMWSYCRTDIVTCNSIAHIKQPSFLHVSIFTCSRILVACIYDIKI